MLAGLSYNSFILQKSFFLMQAISTENDTLLLDVYDENKLVRLMLVCFVRVLAHLPLHSFTITFPQLLCLFQDPR